MDMPRTVWKSTAINLLMFATLHLSLGLAAAEKHHPTPIWRFHLKEVGYEKRENDTAKIYTIGYVKPNLTFLGDDAVVAGFVTGSTKQPPLTGTWVLHLVMLDSRNGRVRGQRTFPLEGHESGIFASSGGNLIVWLGPSLLLLNREFETIAQLQLPKSSNPAWRFLRFVISATRQTLFVASTDTANKLEPTGDVIDTGALERKRLCKYSRQEDFPETITDSQAARINGKTMLVSRLCDESHPVTPPKQCAALWAGSIHFVNDDLLAVTCSDVVPKTPFTRVSSTTFLLKPSGTVLMARNAGKKERAESVLMSPDGHRFALVSSLLGGVEIPAFDMYYHDVRSRVAVYDTGNTAERLVFQIEPHASGIAMAGDGSMLAATVGEEIQAFVLPK